MEAILGLGYIGFLYWISRGDTLDAAAKVFLLMLGILIPVVIVTVLGLKP